MTNNRHLFGPYLRGKGYRIKDRVIGPADRFLCSFRRFGNSCDNVGMAMKRLGFVDLQDFFGGERDENG